MHGYGGGACYRRKTDMRRLAITSFLLVLTIAACGRDPVPDVAPGPASGPAPTAALWDHRERGAEWTRAAQAALDGHGAVLVKMVPQDIEAYCPGYVTAGVEGRKAFWVMFLSALAKHESTWRADASGGGGQWHGLLQISPATARGYGCRATSASELKRGAANLSCGVRIMAVTVPRDGVISDGMRGVAADWGPFHQAGKRADIKAATRGHPACRGA